MCFFCRTSKWNEIRPFWIVNRTLKKHSWFSRAPGSQPAGVSTHSCTKIWFLQTSMEIPIVKNWRWCDARFFNDFKAAVKLQQHYPGLLKQKNVLRLCRLLLRHVSLMCCFSFCDNKKNPWWWEIWVCLSIRLSQLSKVKSNGKTNKLEGMLSVITEVTCEMQAFPGNSLLISEQLDKIYLTFSLQSKQR